MGIFGMNFGAAFIIIAVLIILIWIIVEFKRFKHKIFAILLIIIILFFYISITYTLKGQGIDLKTPSGMLKAAKIYFVWMGSAFSNLKSITSNAVRMDWSAKNNTIG